MSASTAAAESTAAAGPNAAGVNIDRPSTTRVTILTGKRMTDVALPASSPMHTYVDDTVAALAELLEDTPASVLAGFDFAAQGTWTFARPGLPPLRLDQSLDEAGVVDGSLLTLMPVSRTERYRPLVEDVIDAIAVLEQAPQFDRAAVNRLIVVAIPVVTLALTVLAVQRWDDLGRSQLWPLTIGVLGVLALLGSWFAVRSYQRVDFAESLFIAAYTTITVAVTLAIPPAGEAAGLGATQLAGAAGVVMLLTLVTRGGPAKRRALATSVVVTAIGATSAAIAFGYGWQQWVPVGSVVFGLFLLTSAAKFTVAFARIALPPIPAPGEAVGRDELTDPVAGRHETVDDSSKWSAIVVAAPESTVRLTERSTLARQLLIGFVTAGTLILAVGTVALIERGHFFVHTLVVAALVTVMCGLRSRLFAERWCAWSLLAAALAIPVGVIARLSQWYPQHAWLMLSAYLAATVVILAVVASTAAVRRISPVAKRMLELFDGAVGAAIIPMLLWISGIFDVVRNLRF